MACANRKQQPSSLIEDFNSLNLFGKCQPEDLIFCNDEEKKRERKFIEAQKKRENELKRQEQKRKEEENAYRDFMKEVEKKELRKRNGISHAPSMSRGRGSLLNSGVSDSHEIPTRLPRGRGRLSPQEIGRLSLFERTQKVQKNLQQFSESSLHNNAVQKLYWTNLAQNKEEEEYDRYTTDSYNTSYTDSSSTSDQYEDADGSPYTSSPQSFISVPSRSSGSPVSAASPGLEPAASRNFSPLQPLTHPKVASPSPRTRKPRASRLAAKFSNNVEEEDVNEETPYNEIEQKYTSEGEAEVASGSKEGCEDPLAVLGTSRASTAPFKFRMGHRSAGVSFNSLNPSQRVLSNNVLRPEELYYANAGASNEFTLDINDFPAL